MPAVPNTKRYCALSLQTIVALLFTAAISNGQPLTSNLTFSPTRIDFGNVRIRSTTDQKVTLTNSCGTCGSSAIVVSAVSVSGTGFSLSGISLPVTLNAGQSTSFTVTFNPTTVATISGSVMLTFNAPIPNLAIPLSGAVIQGNLWPKHRSIAFANVQVGTNRIEEETVTNDGGTDVTISAASASGPGFSLSGLWLPPKTLRPGDNFSFYVTFNPTSEVVAAGTLTITSDAADSGLSIPLSGKGEKIESLHECSLAKTNNECKLVIDRANPVAPPTVQMYSGQALTVIVKNPNYYERYFLDYQSGQAAILPDVASSIVQGLLPSLQKLNEFSTVTASVYILPTQPPANSCGASDFAKQDGNQGWKVVSTFNGIESDTGARNFATQTDAEEWMRTNQAP